MLHAPRPIEIDGVGVDGGAVHCVVGHEVLHFDSEDAVVEYVQDTFGGAAPTANSPPPPPSPSLEATSASRRRLGAASAHGGGFFQDDFVVGSHTTVVIFGEFSDRGLGKNTSEAVALMQGKMADIIARTALWSRGTFGLTSDLIIPHIYNLGTYPGSGTTTGGWMSDQLQAAVAAEQATAGYTWSNVTAFDNRIMVFPCLGTSWAGLGSVKGGWSWYSCMPGMTVLMHELGHNFGFTHARFGQAEYGSKLDVMGGGSFAKNDVFSGVQLYGAQWQDPARVTFLKDNWPAAGSAAHCASTPGAACVMDATVRLAPVDAFETANTSLPTASSTSTSWHWGVGYQLPGVGSKQAWVWAEFRSNSTKVAPGLTLNAAPRATSGGIGYTELQDAHPHDSDQGNSNVAVGSAFVFMGTRQGDAVLADMRGASYLATGNRPVLLQASQLHPPSPDEDPPRPPLLTTGVSLLDATGTRLVGRGCDGTGWCESSFAGHVAATIDAAALVAAGSAVFNGSFTGGGAHSPVVAVYAINMTAATATTVVVEATTCAGGTDGHLPTAVAVYAGDYPPYATAMYGGDIGSGAQGVSTPKSCAGAPQGATTFRLNPPFAHVPADATSRLTFVVVGVDRALPAANRTGVFQLRLNVVTGAVPCGGRIYVAADNFWKGGWTQDVAEPTFNGKPHYTKDGSSGSYHMVWRGRTNSWCILTRLDDWAGSYGCATPDTGADSIFNVTWWSGSSVRRVGVLAVAVGGGRWAGVVRCCCVVPLPAIAPPHTLFSLFCCMFWHLVCACVSMCVCPCVSMRHLNRSVVCSLLD